MPRDTDIIIDDIDYLSTKRREVPPVLEAVFIRADDFFDDFRDEIEVGENPGTRQKIGREIRHINKQRDFSEDDRFYLENEYARTLSDLARDLDRGIPDKRLTEFQRKSRIREVPQKGTPDYENFVEILAGGRVYAPEQYNKLIRVIEDRVTLDTMIEVKNQTPKIVRIKEEAERRKRDFLDALPDVIRKKLVRK